MSNLDKEVEGQNQQLKDDFEQGINRDNNMEKTIKVTNFIAYELQENSKFYKKERLEEFKSVHNLSEYKALLTIFFESRYFLYVSNILTMVQVIVLCCDYYGLSKKSRNQVYVAEFVIFWLYFFEIIFRVYIRGSWKKFIFSDD